MKKSLFTVLCLAVFSLIASLNGYASNSVIDKAKDLMKKKNYAQAIEILREAIKEKPKDTNLWIALGYAHEQAGNLASALNAFKKAQQLKLGLEGVALKIINLEKKLRELNKDSSEKEILTEEQKKARTMFEKVLQDWRYGNLESAFANFLDCVELDPSLLADDHGIIRNAIMFYSNKIRSEIPINAYYLGRYKHIDGDLDAALIALRKALTGNLPQEAAEKAKKLIEKIEEAKRSIATATLVTTKTIDKPNETKTQRKKEFITTSSTSVEINITKNDSEITNSTNVEFSSTSSNLSLAQQLANVDADQIYSEAIACMNSKPARAINLLTIATQKKKDPALLLTLGDAYLAHSKSNVSEAIAVYQKIIADFPKSPQAEQAKAKIKALQPTTLQRAKEIATYFEENPDALFQHTQEP